MKFERKKKLKEFSQQQKIKLFDKLFKCLDKHIKGVEKETDKRDWCEDDGLPDEHYLVEELITNLQPDYYEFYNNEVFK